MRSPLEAARIAGGPWPAGRLEPAAGAISGNNAMQAEGEAKQVHAQVMHAAGDLKDKAQQVASAVGDALHGLTGKGG